MFKQYQKNLVPPDPEKISFKMFELSSKIKQARHSHTVTVRELSEITGISSRTIWRLENGKTVKLQSVLNILYALGCDICIEE